MIAGTTNKALTKKEEIKQRIEGKQVEMDDAIRFVSEKSAKNLKPLATHYAAYGLRKT